MLDDMLDYVSQIRERPVWQSAPESVEATFTGSIPVCSQSLSATHDLFMQNVLPYVVGNTHPGFMGWVHGGGTVVGMLAEMMAAGLNSNLGGRDQIPIQVEQQVVRWMRQLFGFPEAASGLFVTGSSMANLIGLLIARTAKVGKEVRQQGLQQISPRLVAYTSTDAHGCIDRAMEIGGMGAKQLRKVAVNDRFEMDLSALESAIAADRKAGFTPFCVIGTAGSVNVGAVDDLNGIANVTQREGLWFHVDGACGALGMMSPKIGVQLKGIERADSIALDFHKWGQVPYDAGFVLVRDSQLHHDTFASPAAYLRRETRGLSAGSPWPCDFGPDLSRSFKALKVWFTLQVFGMDRLGQMMDRTCELARYLALRIEETKDLELLAPVHLNIVCFRYRNDEMRPNGVTAASNDALSKTIDQVNSEILLMLQESGEVAPSSTIIDGNFAIRAAIFNHRTSPTELDNLLNATVRFGNSITQANRMSV